MTDTPESEGPLDPHSAEVTAKLVIGGWITASLGIAQDGTVMAIFYGLGLDRQSIPVTASAVQAAIETDLQARRRTNESRYVPSPPALAELDLGEDL